MPKPDAPLFVNVITLREKRGITIELVADIVKDALTQAHGYLAPFSFEQLMRSQVRRTFRMPCE
jgi:hypothetical protein